MTFLSTVLSKCLQWWSHCQRRSSAQGAARVSEWRIRSGIVLGACVVTLGGVSLGWVEPGELMLLDVYQQQQTQASVDPRIVLVTIDESDLSTAPSRILSQTSPHPPTAKPSNLSKPDSRKPEPTSPDLSPTAADAQAIDVPAINPTVKVEWPLTDEVIMQTLQQILRQNPRVVGLHLYFNPSFSPAREQLKRLFIRHPNIIGMEKVVGNDEWALSIFPEGQLGMSDMVLDRDAAVRRGLVAIYDRQHQTYLSWGVQLATEYLREDGIEAKQRADGSVRFGKTTLNRLNSGDGGYTQQLDTGGFQILLNFRGGHDRFQTVSLRQVLEGRVPPDLFRDKIVAIGPTSPRLKTAYRTPIRYNPLYRKAIATPDTLNTLDGMTAQSLETQNLNPQNLETQSIKVESLEQDEDVRLMPSVLIHLNLTSQLLEAALYGSGMVQGVKTSLEWVWTGMWAVVAIGLYRRTWRMASRPRSWRLWFNPCLKTGAVFITLFGLGYGAFLSGWWLPTIAPALSFSLAASFVLLYEVYQFNRLASYDALTQLHNRRVFDLCLVEAWHCAIRSHRPIALIMCDVDYFKSYNDHYGHPGGDFCLQQVAIGISHAVRNGDIVARYGGEEFAVILPNTDLFNAMDIAERIRQAVFDLNLPHCGSANWHQVTISCGIAALIPEQFQSEHELIKAADLALYRSKQHGRNTCQSAHLSATTPPLTANHSYSAYPNYSDDLLVNNPTKNPAKNSTALGSDDAA